ncbi:MAG: amidase, partial [Roseiarcus sp.]
MTIAAIIADMKRGRTSALAQVDAALARISKRNPDLNAFVAIDEAGARAAAERVDRRLAAGEQLPLAGVPVAMKDTIWVAGSRVTQGSRLFADFHAPTDAIVVERLKGAGAVIVGMTNTSEFACKGMTTNLLYGPTRHPMDPSLTPGGSSGGPVVAVAAGFVPLAIGTDAGGSSRRPPAHVGVVGFKPSFGAIPDGPGFPEPVVGIQSICPITATVEDAALAFEALVGPDPRDPDSVGIEPADRAKPTTLRVAYSPRFGLRTPVDADVASAVDRAIDRLASAGVEITTQDPVWPAASTESALMPLQHAGLAALYGEQFKRDRTVFDPDIAVQIESGFGMTGVEVAAALILSADIARAVAKFFERFDLLIGPTTPCVAWSIDHLGPEMIGGVPVPSRGHAVFTPLFNHARVPAISIPCGPGRSGLPIGLQVVAARGHD